LSNAGGVVVNNGDMSVNGDYNQSASGHLYSFVGYKLNVTGKANIDGTLHIAGFKTGFVPTTGVTTSILTAGAGLQGTFKDVVIGNGLITATTSYTGNSVDVNAKLNSVASVASGEFMGKQASVATMDETLKVVEAKVQRGQTLTKEEEAYFNSAAFAPSISSVIFQNSNTAVKNSTQNFNIAQADMNLSTAEQFMNDKTHMFMGGESSKVKTSFSGINGKRDGNQFHVGGTYKLNDNSTLLGQIHTGKSNWNESMMGLTNYSNVDFSGLTVGYNHKFDHDVNVFVLAGHNWTETKFNGDKIDGKQNYLGLGVNQKWTYGDFSITPQLYVQTLKHSLDGGNAINSLNARQNSVTGAVYGNYALNEKVSLNAMLAYSKDFSVKNEASVNTLGVNSWDNSVYLPGNRFTSKIGIQYRPTQQLSVYALYKHTYNSNWKDNTIQAGLLWNF
jgi:hypothetical protein